MRRARERYGRHRFLGSVGAMAGAQYAAAAIGLVTTTVVARSLGPTDFGTLSLAIAYPGILYSFIGLKSLSVTTRYVTRYRSEERWSDLLSITKLGFLLDLSVALLTLVVVVATGGWVARSILRTPEAAPMMPIVASAFPFLSFVGTGRATLVSWERFGVASVLQLVEPVLVLGLSAIAAVQGAPASGFALAMAAGQAVYGVTMLVVATAVIRRDAGRPWWKGTSAHSKLLGRELRGLFGWNYLLTTFSGALGYLPSVLLGRFGSPREAGFFRLANTIAVASSYLETSLARVALPLLSKKETHLGSAELRERAWAWTRRAGVPAAGLVALGALVLPVAVPLVFGHAYAPVSPGTQLLLGAVALSSLFFWMEPAHLASGNIKRLALGVGGQLLLVAPLGALVAGRYGFVATCAVVAGTRALSLTYLVWPILRARRTPVDS